jgi:hypothetical protein
LIDLCTLSENTAQFGGGIFMDSAVGLTGSTLSGNRALVGGGVFLNAGESDVSNVTLSGNTAAAGGGGLFNNATVRLFHATVTRNAAEAGGGLFNNVGTLVIKNTIVAQNQATDGAAGGPDVNGEFATNGSNLVGIVDGSSGFGATFNDLLGTAAAPLDARLKPLADNGGPTLTHALKSGSLAIDEGDDLGFVTDQRGFDRDRDGDGDGTGGVDIGALEK